MNENTNLDFIASEIKQYYTLKKALKIKRPSFNPPATAEKAFRTAAEICMELNADPEIYVNAIFSRVDAEITADFLCCAKAKSYYREYMEKTQLSLEELYNVQKMYLSGQITQAKRPVEVALMDDDILFTPWFRICITKQPNDEVMSKYLAQAKEQFTPKLKKFLIDNKLDYTRIHND